MDDYLYLPKPLDVDDLLAVVHGKLLAAERLKNLFDREANGAEVITLTINEQPVRLDYRQHRVRVEDQEVELTVREVFLLDHPCVTRFKSAGPPYNSTAVSSINSVRRLTGSPLTVTRV